MKSRRGPFEKYLLLGVQINLTHVSLCRQVVWLCGKGHWSRYGECLSRICRIWHPAALQQSHQGDSGSCIQAINMQTQRRRDTSSRLLLTLCLTLCSSTNNLSSMVVTGSVATALEKTGQVCVSAELQGKPDLGSGVWSDDKNHIKRYMSDYGKN